MDIAFVIIIVETIVLLFLAGFFSCTETAITAVTDTEARTLTNNKKDKLTIKLLSIKDNIVSTTLVGTNLTNNLLTSLVTAFAINQFNGSTRAKFTSTVIITILIIFFAEILPKTLATYAALNITRISAPILNFFRFVFLPITWILSLVSNAILSFISIFQKKGSPTLTEAQLKTLIEISTEDGAVNGNEKYLLTGAVRLRELKLINILTPRTNIQGVFDTDGIKEVISAFRKVKYSRLPIFSSENPNAIVGILHYKDLLFKKAKNSDNILDFKRKAIYVPVTASVFSVISTMKNFRVNMVIAIDEHGETAGLVTMDDIIAAVFGTINDEYDVESGHSNAKKIEPIDTKTVRIHGDTELYYINEVFRISLYSAHYNTLAGFLLEKAEVLPNEGQSFNINNIKFTVEKIKDRKIVSVIADISQIKKIKHSL